MRLTLLSAPARSMAAVVLVLAAAWPARAQESAGGASRVSHAITVSLDPASRTLTVDDVVRLPGTAGRGVVEFALNAALALTRSDPPARAVAPPAGAPRPGATEGQAPLKRYRVALRPGQALSLSYSGAIDLRLSAEKEQYTRGFRQTAGGLGPEGVYLAGSTTWYPSFGPGLVEFTLDAIDPEGWHLIAQGSGTSRDATGRARWESGGPTDEIYLVGGPLQVFRARAGSVDTLVYLHARDQELAGRYLAATARYLEMYSRLIGPYPYSKFALVENFWETGYGMPSFTLLGPEVIRFPFIITSSYPHEILHNWWGNGVFVDEESGNWSEGLTAYLADHLLQEQRGLGAEYRRATLQKYRDYVREGRDFPLTAFRGRDSAATEAVGYGKALMAFHMARLSVGDASFRKAIADFYARFKGARAGWGDFRRALEAASGSDFSRFFQQWIGRAGAPALALIDVRADGRRVSGALRQTQEGPPFALDVPVAIETVAGVVRRKVRLESAEQRFSLEVEAEPIALHLDPDFDVFRTLDPRETPPSIGQIFGEPRALAIVPASAPEEERQRWRSLFEGWRSDSHALEIRTDAEVQALPADRAVWIAGRGNKFAASALRREGVRLVRDAVELDGQRVPLAGHTVVLIDRHPASPDKAIGLLLVDPVAAFPGLGRKLPHYGKYSYLAFEGGEPANVLKGQWAASDSPMSVALQAPASRGVSSRLPPLAPESRKPLADLPPAFSEQAPRPER